MWVVFGIKKGKRGGEEEEWVKKREGGRGIREGKRGGRGRVEKEGEGRRKLIQYLYIFAAK